VWAEATHAVERQSGLVTTAAGNVASTTLAANTCAPQPPGTDAHACFVRHRAAGWLAAATCDLLNIQVLPWPHQPDLSDTQLLSFHCALSWRLLATKDQTLCPGSHGSHARAHVCDAPHHMRRPRQHRTQHALPTAPPTLITGHSWRRTPRRFFETPPAASASASTANRQQHARAPSTHTHTHAWASATQLHAHVHARTHAPHTHTHTCVHTHTERESARERDIPLPHGSVADQRCQAAAQGVVECHADTHTHTHTTPRTNAHTDACARALHMRQPTGKSNPCRVGFESRPPIVSKQASQPGQPLADAPRMHAQHTTGVHLHNTTPAMDREEQRPGACREHAALHRVA
jgi:hypothetical protein